MGRPPAFPQSTKQIAWTGQGGAPYELNDLEARQAICFIKWEDMAGETHNYLRYLRASVFYGNEIGVKVAEASINVRMNKQALSDLRVCEAYEVALRYWCISLYYRQVFKTNKHLSRYEIVAK